MTYFHPWTLRAQDADIRVPYAGALRHHDMLWEDAMSEWLNGHVVSAEAARYVGHFLSVYRVRPRDGDEEVRSDEDVIDEELVLTHDDLQEALQTQIGGKDSEHPLGRTSADAGKATHEENSRTGMDWAKQDDQFRRTGSDSVRAFVR